MSEFFKSIQEVAGAPTPRKEPSAAPASGSPDQSYIPEEKKREQAAEAAKAVIPEKKPEVAVVKMGKEEAIAAGKGSAHLITDSIETILTVCELFRFVFSMSPEQKQKIELLQNKSVSEWTEEDKFLMQVLLKQQSKHEKIKENIGFKPSAVTDMAESMATYHEITGKKMSPEVIIASTIGKHLAMKLSDMFL